MITRFLEKLFCILLITIIRTNPEQAVKHERPSRITRRETSFWVETQKHPPSLMNRVSVEFPLEPVQTAGARANEWYVLSREVRSKMTTNNLD